MLSLNLIFEIGSYLAPQLQGQVEVTYLFDAEYFGFKPVVARMPNHPIDLSAEPKEFGAIWLRSTHIQLILEETIENPRF